MVSECFLGFCRCKILSGKALLITYSFRTVHFLWIVWCFIIWIVRSDVQLCEITPSYINIRWPALSSHPFQITIFVTEKAYFRNLSNQFLWHVAPWDLIQISPDQHPVCGCVYQPKINKQCTALSLLCLEHTTWNELSQPDHSPLAKRVDNSPSSSYFLKGHSSQSKCFFF